MGMDYSTLLTPEILVEMPSNLTPQDQLMWRRNKINEIKARHKLGIDDSNSSMKDRGGAAESVSQIQSTVPLNDVAPADVSTETNDNDTEPAFEQPVEFDNSEQETAENEDDEADLTDTVKHTSSSKSRRGRPINRVSASEDIKSLPKNVMAAVRRRFAVSASKADLISAMVYIFTNGDCEISDTAMDVVRSYSSENPMIPVNAHLDEIDERFDNLERMMRHLVQTSQSIELCTCYNTFDRRYGSSIKRAKPKDTEFREPGNLDMLARLREQAADQIKIDNATRGRETYNAINAKKSDKK